MTSPAPGARVGPRRTEGTYVVSEHQQEAGRVRRPRVHISYDVEVGNAIELKELPFVMGVLGDYTGQPTEPLPPEQMLLHPLGQ